MRTFRVYFNRKREAPQVWSVDEGTQETEVNVVNFFIGPGVTAKGHYDPIPVNDNTPSAYMEVKAEGYDIIHGVVMFYVYRMPVDGRP